MDQKVLAYALGTYTVKEILGGSYVLKEEEREHCQNIQMRCTSQGVEGVIVKEDSRFHSMQHIVSPPHFLFWVGDVTCLYQPLLGVVGPRRPSPYAASVIEDLGKTLSQYHLGLLSGGARGIDTRAHTYALKNKITTVLVLGSGCRYALQHDTHGLLHRIIDHGGLVLSEFGLDQEPLQRTFPRRNRLIAGLSTALFVPSAGERSGTGVTIDFALQMHKHVYSVPASIYEEASRKTNDLIAEKKIHAVTDHEQRLNKHFARRKGIQETDGLFASGRRLSTKEQQILTYLNNHGPSSVDDIVASLEYTISEIYEILTSLEMGGQTTSLQPGVYTSVT